MVNLLVVLACVAGLGVWVVVLWSALGFWPMTVVMALFLVGAIPGLRLLRRG